MKIIEVSGIESKFTKVALTIVAVLLIFVGPTYIPYLLADVGRFRVMLLPSCWALSYSSLA